MNREGHLSMCVWVCVCEIFPCSLYVWWYNHRVSFNANINVNVRMPNSSRGNVAAVAIELMINRFRLFSFQEKRKRFLKKKDIKKLVKVFEERHLFIAHQTLILRTPTIQWPQLQAWSRIYKKKCYLFFNCCTDDFKISLHDSVGPVGWGCRIHRLHFCRGVRWWGSSDAGALGNAENPFIAISPRSTLARRGSTW